MTDITSPVILCFLTGKQQLSEVNEVLLCTETPPRKDSQTLIQNLSTVGPLAFYRQLSGGEDDTENSVTQ